MKLSPKLLEILVCPKCRGALRYQSAPERLECSRCALAYPVTAGIPVMLVDEAKPIS